MKVILELILRKNSCWKNHGCYMLMIEKENKITQKIVGLNTMLETY